MNRTLVLLVIGISFIFLQVVNSQTDHNISFLQKVGTLDSIYSESLKEYRKIYVQLPANFNAREKEKYPVVYILDGEVLLPTVNNVQEFYSGGFTPDMVLIGISNDKNRMRDLTTSKVTEMYGMPFEQENGDAANFSNFLETELIPFVENKYPVTNFRTLIGHSYGGLFTLFSLVHHPHLFSNYIAIDPSLDWDNQKLFTEAQSMLATKDYKGKSLFMSLNGQLNMQDPTVTIDNVMQDTSDFTFFPRSNIAFSNIVKQNKQNGLALEWKFYPRDLHGTIAFPSIMDGLISVFRWYQMENTSKFNSPETSKKELSEIIKYRAKKLKTYFKYSVPPYPEDLLNMLGNMSLDMEQPEKAKMFFDFDIEFYPNSPNAYDSMADYYERTDDYKNALKFVTKAYEISGDNYYKERMEALKKK
ncbi:alpha/beta hydrolase-fold protein [Aequorivita marisscotiae]|uniref:Alpha/beta hydrolase-fold protein n=1 Tax=Aequorivita marisscotiae TaxID=3040348 RepID=A0ABY8KU54_9FLAO|nr:alpha/beta hydrolase-fold protein [Aequorivita sp. Ant34-E75]WGF91690.1 alpha/beta hydrolase-fold protein [Aequorivita sp. Ant34-E75]